MMMIAAVRRTREGERERKKNKTPLKRRDPPRGVQGESSQTIFFPRERETHRLEKTNAPREDPNGQARARESRGRVHFKSAWRGVDACS